MLAGHDTTETRIQVQKLNELPPMPLVVQELLRVLGDEDAEVREIADIVERDPALFARIIGVANSAYFNCPEPVTRAEEAIFKVLGLNTAKSIALGIVLGGAFDASRCPAFRASEFWLSGMLAAHLAQRLAPAVAAERLRPADVYLCGLLHHLGLLTLVHLYPDEMNRLFLEHREECQESLTEAERELLGVTHLEAGGWLGRRWHLPATAVAVLEHCRDADYRGDHWAAAQLVRLAVAACEALCRGDGATGDAETAALLGIAPDRLEAALAELAVHHEDLVALASTLAGGEA